MTFNRGNLFYFIKSPLVLSKISNLFTSTKEHLDQEHHKNMNEIRKNHENAMLAKQKQARLEEAEHQKMMERIEQQREKAMQTGNIDILQFSGIISS